MSDEVELTGDDALAAEHALGLLSPADAQAAEARMARDPEFGAAVEAWRMRLAPLADEAAPAPAPSALWGRINSRLPANDDNAEIKLRFWRRATAAASLAAAAGIAAVVVLLANGPTISPAGNTPAARAILNASLAGDDATPLFIASYYPERQAMVITSLVPAGTDPGHAHQLWLVPSGKAPQPLGIIEPGTSRALPMTPQTAQSIIGGAQLAVSVEPPGGSRSKTGPSGPIAASGKLRPI